jgi:YD repeat-containing protein
MPIFNQRGQQVTYQYNAAGAINVGTVERRIDLAGGARATAAGADSGPVGGRL